MVRMQYLKEHRPGLYTRLLLSGKLNDDPHQADVHAQYLLYTMILKMAKEAGVTGQMKMTDQLRWVGMMNAIKNQAEEITWETIVYKQESGENWYRIEPAAPFLSLNFS